MSRTIKKPNPRENWKLPPKKMQPLLKDSDTGNLGFVADCGRGLGISKLGKLVAKNANRSLKKAARQEIKLNIKKGYYGTN